MGYREGAGEVLSLLQVNGHTAEVRIPKGCHDGKKLR